MRITIDTESGTLEVVERGASTDCPLFSAEAFRLLSRQWLALGWNLGHWKTFSWMGRRLLQFPDDALRLAELLWTVRPDVIVETGVYDGGGTLFLASLCRLRGGGRVIAVERDLRAGVAEAIRRDGGGLVTLFEGDSGSPETGARVRQAIRPGESVCVFLDSDHAARHVAAELRELGPLVSQGCYLIVADSILPELAHVPEGEPGWAADHPGIAVDEFLAAHPEFLRDPPPFAALSYFPDTWLRRNPAPPPRPAP